MAASSRQSRFPPGPTTNQLVTQIAQLTAHALASVTLTRGGDVFLDDLLQHGERDVAGLQDRVVEFLE